MSADEQDFDPEDFDEERAERALREGIGLFDAGSYVEAHEAFEQCWLASEAGDADFYKGLIQAAICLHHLEDGNLEGARKLYAGHRRLLAPFLPIHRGVDLARFLAAVQAYVMAGLAGALATAERPRLG